MLDLIDNLPSGTRVLDLGARSGSFSTTRTDVAIVRLDLEIPAARQPGAYVSGDAALMPFADAVFDVVISNHSLEHFCELERTVREIGRVIRQGGTLYVAVPDATTLTDRIYRWLGKGGGHVNAFRSPEEVAALIEKGTHLPLRGTTVLYSSLSFLNAHNFTNRPPRKIALFGFGNEYFLALFVHVLRCVDRMWGTRLERVWVVILFRKVGLPGAGRAVAQCVRALRRGQSGGVFARGGGGARA